MDVLFVNERADFVGGAERHVADLAARLRERGHRCTLLYGVAGWTEPRFTGRFDAAFPFVSARSQVEEIGPDVVYVHQLRDADRLSELVEAGYPVVRYFHDHHFFCPRTHKYTTLTHQTCVRTVGPACYPCLGIIHRTDRWPRIGLRTVGEVRREISQHRSLTATVVGSAYMREHAIAHGLDAERVHVIPPFVEAPPPPAEEPVRDPRRLLFVGALLRGKGLDVLLDALTRLPDDVRLEVVGDGSQAALYRELAERLDLKDRVCFVGTVDPEALSARYRSAACVVVPSRAPETFGMTGPEALLHGTPVVASAAGGVGEWLTDGITGYAFPSGQPAELAAVLRQVLADPAEAARRARAGAARCRERFGVDTHVTSVLSLFGRIA